MFVVTKHVFCHDKSMYVATKLFKNILWNIFWQAYFCRDKKKCFVTCFVATKMVLVAAAANDTPLPSHHCLHTTAFTPLPSHHCLHTTAFTSLPSHHCLHTTAFTPLPSLHCLHTTAFTPLPSHHCLHTTAFTPLPSHHCLHKLLALVYNIFLSTTAVFSYVTGSRKLSANEQFFWLVLKQ